MKQTNWKDIAELIGIAAIVISLALLIVEVRQNTTAMTATAYQARSEALQELAVIAATSEVLSRIQANYQRRRESCEEADLFCYEIDHAYIQSLSPTEYRQYRNFLTAHAHRLSNLTVQYEYGLLTDEYHLGGVVGAIKGFIPRWEAFDVPQGRRLADYVAEFESRNQ